MAFESMVIEELSVLRAQVAELQAQVAEALNRSQEILEEIERIWTADPEAGAGEPKP